MRIFGGIWNDRFAGDTPYTCIEKVTERQTVTCAKTEMSFH